MSSSSSSRVMMDQLVDEAMELMEVENVATVFFLKTCVKEHFHNQNHHHSCVKVYKEIAELKKLYDNKQIFKMDPTELGEKYVTIKTVLNLCDNNPCTSAKAESYISLLF